MQMPAPEENSTEFEMLPASTYAISGTHLGQGYTAQDRRYDGSVQISDIEQIPVASHNPTMRAQGAVAVPITKSDSVLPGSLVGSDGALRSRPFWCMPHSLPLDYSDPADCEYAASGIRSLYDCLNRLCSRTHRPSDAMGNIRKALLLLHVNRLMNYFNDNLPEYIALSNSPTAQQRTSVTGSSNQSMQYDGSQAPFDASAHMEYSTKLKRFRAAWEKLGPLSLSRLEGCATEIDEKKTLIAEFNNAPVTVHIDSRWPRILTQRYLLLENPIVGRMLCGVACVLWVTALLIVFNFFVHGSSGVTVTEIIIAVLSIVMPGAIIVYLYSKLMATTKLMQLNDRALTAFLEQVVISGAGPNATDVLPTRVTEARPYEPIVVQEPSQLPSSVPVASQGPLMRQQRGGGSIRSAVTESVHSGAVAMLPVSAREMTHVVTTPDHRENGNIKLPWDVIHKCLVVIAVRHSDDPAKQKIVYWNAAAKAATGLDHIRKRLDETVDETSVERLTELVRNGKVDKDQVVELRFHNNTAGSVLLRLRPLATHVVSGRHPDVSIVLLVGHDRVEDTSALQTIVGYRQCVNQILSSPLRRELVADPQRTRLHKPFVRFLDDALSWVLMTKVAKGMARWNTFTTDDLKRELSPPRLHIGNVIVVVSPTLPPKMCFDRQTMLAIQRIVTLLHRSDREFPIQAKFELVDMARFPAFRVIFTPTSAADIESVFTDTELPQMEKEAGLAIELYRASVVRTPEGSAAPNVFTSQSKVSIRSEQGDIVSNSGDPITLTEQLALIAPFTRRDAADGERDDLPAHAVREKDRTTLSVLLMVNDDFTQKVIRNLLNDTEQALVQRASDLTSFEQKLSGVDPVHIVILDKTLEDLTKLRDAAFESKWGDHIIVSYATLDDNREPSLEPVSLGATGGGGIQGWNASERGEPIELKGHVTQSSEGVASGDEREPVPRQYTLYLPARQKPLKNLLDIADAIERDRRQAKQAVWERELKLQVMNINFVPGAMISEGTFGVVRHAIVNQVEHLALKTLSTKTVKKDEGRSAMERCMGEDEALAACSGSRFVVKLRYKKKESETMSFFLELCDLNLTDIVGTWEGQPPVTTEQNVTEGVRRMKSIARVLLQLTSALRDVHRAGWVHHDVKPENVMAVKVEPSESCGFGWEIRLLDFSEAARKSMPCNSTPGTMGYIAPEMYGDGSVSDIKVDIYSLGVLAMAISGWAPIMWAQVCRDKHFGGAMNLQLRDLIETNFKSHPPHRSETMNALRRMLLQFVSACLHQAASQRPEAEGLLQYPLLRWIRSEVDNGGICVCKPSELMPLPDSHAAASPTLGVTAPDGSSAPTPMLQTQAAIGKDAAARKPPRGKVVAHTPASAPVKEPAVKQASPVASGSFVNNISASNSSAYPSPFAAASLGTFRDKPAQQASAASTPHMTPTRPPSTPDPDRSDLGTGSRPRTPAGPGRPATPLSVTPLTAVTQHSPHPSAPPATAKVGVAHHHGEQAEGGDWSDNESDHSRRSCGNNA
jgi:serine/threonine protein kinase